MFRNIVQVHYHKEDIMTRANFYKMHDAYFKAHDELER